jgi:hypothetical protein
MSQPYLLRIITVIGAFALSLASPSTYAQDEESAKGGAERDDASARLEWQRETNGVVTSQFRQLEINQANLHNAKKNAPGPKWVNIGPEGADSEQNGSFTGHVRDSGRARTILAHPEDPEIVYFLTSGGGLWRTNNWSAPSPAWTALTDNLPTTGGGSVAFGKNPNTLYLGLGDPYDQILVGGSMVKSKNGGVSWSPLIELGTAVGVRDVKVDTSTNRDIVMVATESGLFRSADDGDTYSAVSTFNGMSVWSIVKTSAGWLASAQNCPAASVGLQCGQATTLFLSTDRGATWAPISNLGNVFSANGRTTLAVGAPGASVVYAYSSTVTDSAMRDVYRSADGGQTWVANGVNSTKIPTNPVPGATNQPNMNICGAQCWYNQSITVDPADPNTVWIGGNLATASSSDGGNTWTLRTWWLYSQMETLVPPHAPLPYAHADHHAAAFKTTGTKTLILGNDGGLNVSTDNGATFSSDKNNGIVSHLYYTIAGNPKFPNLVIGGLQDNGTRLRTDNGTIHNQVIGGDGLGAAYSQGNTNTVIGSSQGSGMRTNLSNTAPTTFQNWASATSGLSDVGFPFGTCIVPAPANLDSTGRVFFHFTNARVWRTNNGGLNWILIGSAVGVPSPGLPPARRFRSSPYNLGVSPIDLNHIAVGAAGGFLDITTDGGATWTDIDLITKVPGYQGFVTNVTWQDNQNLWITSVAQATGALRVIKASIATPTSSWSTATFAAKQNGLPDLPVTRVLFDPRDTTRNTILGATHVGVYRTSDGGNNWTAFSNGLPTVRVNDIYMPPDGSSTRIATYGRGVWELVQVELVSTSLSDAISSCDSDGVLDNGEKGWLTVNLINQGPNNVNQGSLTFSSSNPKVTFPQGATVAFPPATKNGGKSTAKIPVALNGAVGIENTTFTIAVDAPALALPSPFNVTSTHRLNYDEATQSSTTETFESANPGWTVSGNAATMPNIVSWQSRALSPVDHVYFGPDNNGQIDGVKASAPDEQILTSPTFTVGTGTFTIGFRHRFSFEAGNWDGGIVEISTNNGATWTKIGTAGSPYNGSTNAGTSAPIGAGTPAFVSRSATWPLFIPASINLGTTYANQNVQIRFRTGSDDSTGAPGWDIDDVALTGVTTMPFTALVPETGTCP